MDETLRQVLAIFVDEYREHASAITDGLIQAGGANAPRRRELLADVFRRAHSMKASVTNTRYSRPMRLWSLVSNHDLMPNS